MEDQNDLEERIKLTCDIMGIGFLWSRADIPMGIAHNPREVQDFARQYTEDEITGAISERFKVLYNDGHRERLEYWLSFYIERKFHMLLVDGEMIEYRDYPYADGPPFTININLPDTETLEITYSFTDEVREKDKDWLKDFFSKFSVHLEN